MYHGRGHDEGGIEATGQGELVVDCPQCPHADRNLRSGWELVPEEDR